MKGGKMKHILKTIFTKSKFVLVKYSIGIIRYRRNTNYLFLLFPEMTTVHNSCLGPSVVFVFSFHQCIFTDILLCTRTVCQNTRVQEYPAGCSHSLFPPMMRTHNKSTSKWLAPHHYTEKGPGAGPSENVFFRN